MLKWQSTSLTDKQETWTLEALIEKALQQNVQINTMRFDQSLAEKDVEKVNTSYLPYVSATLTGTYTNLPLNAFGTKLNQGAIGAADFAPPSLNSPDGIDNLQTRVEVRQPILNFDVKHMWEAAESKVEATQFQVKRAEENIEYEISKAYQQLQFLYKYQQTLRQTQATTEANLKLTKDNVDAGYLKQVDVFSIEIRVAEVEDQILNTQHNIRNLSDFIYFLIGEEAGDKIISPSDSLSQLIQSGLQDLDIESRSDFNAYQSGIKARESQLKATQNVKLPRLNAFGSYEFNNRIDFEDSADGYLLGVQLSWNAFEGNRNLITEEKQQLEIQKAKLEYQLYVDQNQLKLQAAKRMLTHAQSKIALSDRSIRQGKEKLRILTNRYEEGLEKSTDLLNAETDLAQKQLARLQAILDFNLAATDIQFLTEK